MGGCEEVAKRDNCSQISIVIVFESMKITLNLFIEPQQKFQGDWYLTYSSKRDKEKSNKKKEKKPTDGIKREQEGKIKEIRESNSQKSDLYC